MAEQKVLAQLRKQIDAVDTQLVELLNERAQIARRIGKAKKGGPVYRPEREAQILRRISELAQLPLTSERVQAVFREIIAACRAVQQPIVATYLGPKGTYSEEATVAHFGVGIELLPAKTFGDVLRLTEQGKAQFAVLPIENSSEGAVTQVLDLLLDTSLVVCGELSLPIHHQLLSSAETIQEIKEVHAHPQALAQCREWLQRHVPHALYIPAASNGAAAELATSRPDIAAIAGKAAAREYGLLFLATDIEDDATNSTRFVVLGKNPAASSGKDKTSIICSAPNKPGALQRLLEVFTSHGVNLLKLESRPMRGGVWDYVFYLDLEGHIEDERIEAALKAAKGRATFVKILGSYPRMM